MLIYILLICYILLLLIAVKKRIISSKGSLIAAFVVFALVVGFRGDTVGEDTMAYLSIARGSMSRTWSQIITEYPNSIWGYTSWGSAQTIETGYLLFNKAIMTIWKNEYVVLLISSCLTSLGFARFIWKNTEDVGESIWIYLCESLFLTSFNLTRQTLAMAIALQSFCLIKEKKFVKAILWILLASTIHASAIICLIFIPIYFFANKKESIKYFIIACVIIPFLMPLLKIFVSYVLPAYTRYFSNNYWEVQLGGIILLWGLLAIGIINMVCKVIERQEERFFAICGVLYLCLEFMSLQISGLTRMALFPRAFLLFLYPVIFRYLSGNVRLIYKIALNLLVLMLFISGASSESRLYVPYWSN